MPKRILQGVVVSDKQEKTLVVKVERRFAHLEEDGASLEELPRSRRKPAFKVGDQVSIEETKPISKLKAVDRFGELRRKPELLDHPE